MRSFALVLASACSYQSGSVASGSNTDAPVRSDARIIDAPTQPDGGDPFCGWGYKPTNFDPCMLPSGAMPLAVSGAAQLNTDTTPSAHVVITQSDGSQMTLIHVTTLDLATTGSLVVVGTVGAIIAVDGAAVISGPIAVSAGQNDAVHCATARGAPGVDSGNFNSGGGGGGGGGAADVGGDGTDGSGGMGGAKGTHGAATAGASSLAPMRGGCPGGSGGLVTGGSGTRSAGGRGGGALQISARQTISITSAIDASGAGGAGAGLGGIGGGGGGAGGGILLEAPNVQVAAGAHLCADGGSGGEGGGNSASGYPGNGGACNGTSGATTMTVANTAGGSGGDGSYSGHTSGGTAGAPTQMGGGGGGGGAVGWIRIHSPAPSTSGAVITPAALVN